MRHNLARNSRFVDLSNLLIPTIMRYSKYKAQIKINQVTQKNMKLMTRRS